MNAAEFWRKENGPVVVPESGSLPFFTPFEPDRARRYFRGHQYPVHTVINRREISGLERSSNLNVGDVARIVSEDVFVALCPAVDVAARDRTAWYGFTPWRGDVANFVDLNNEQMRYVHNGDGLVWERVHEVFCEVPPIPLARHGQLRIMGVAEGSFGFGFRIGGNRNDNYLHRFTGGMWIPFPMRPGRQFTDRYGSRMVWDGHELVPDPTVIRENAFPAFPGMLRLVDGSLVEYRNEYVAERYSPRQGDIVEWDGIRYHYNADLGGWCQMGYAEPSTTFPTQVRSQT